ncbi:MAG: NYN domain-containing protein [Gammaproteobacteria bacterium]|nr:NYN domain-containing protein [Gammaproteobacteria bacterium]MDH3446869.1 NYN domain-containing protein [Gammaproteobacteria bacterium]
MSSGNEDQNLAIFCDFENIALGVRDEKMDKFNINLILERLLVKGSVVFKKAYCDWERYKEFKAVMHDAAFELIEIPHTRQSGKNSADIRMVVDALDLCYTKEHIDTFVIISGDSDFSPLVSKLRENNKVVIGVGVKSSTSDLLMNNCDEFIFYDDLARDEESSKQRKRRRKPATKKKTASKEDAKPREKDASEDDKIDEAIGLIMETAEALYAERGDRDKLWGSMIKQALKRRRPGFNESYYGVRSFSDLLEEAERRGLVGLSLDERSGGYVIQKIESD